MPHNIIRFENIHNDTVQVTISDAFDLDLMEAMSSIY
tara:strand:+ start:92557 stop:92667 length:111 start_codon:yes stop_codon:yes gene_type:complete